MGVQIPQGEGAISGVVRAIQNHWQSSLHQRHAAEGIIHYAGQAQIVF